AGTRLVKTCDASQGIRAVGVLDGSALFIVRRGFPSSELWRTDGTDAGTEKVQDITPAPNMLPVLGPAGGRIYFNGYDVDHGVELWSMQRPTAPVFVRGSAWSAGFKNHLDATGAGDGAYGYRVDDQGGGDVLPWVNVNEVVVRLPPAATASGMPPPGMVTFQSQRGVAYTVTRVDPVPGDPRAFAF